MPTSQNNYGANDRSQVRSATIPGTDVQVAVRKGPAGDLLLYAAARWHREVEPLRAGDGVLDCWGYAERTIRGSSTTLSNHASGTALDLRARAHPLGRRATFTAVQVAAIHRIIADCRAIRWGGDYNGRPDEMHIEIVASESACALALSQLAAPPSTRPDPGGTAMATLDDVARKVDLLKPGVALDARSRNCRSARDDHFGAALNGWAEAADARVAAASAASDTAALRREVAELRAAVANLPAAVVAALRSATS